MEKIKEEWYCDVQQKAEKSIHYNHGEWVRGPMLGKGSYGCVHLAIFSNPLSTRFRGFPPVVAVKSALSSSSAELKTEKMLYDRLGTTPFIIRCFGEDITVAEDGQLFHNLFLEYASGGTLFDLIKLCQGFGLLESHARKFLRSILQGISHIHQAGFIHCDLKPKNILLAKEKDEDEEFAAKISDFGFARSAEESKLKSYRVKGTLLYLSPESIRDEIQEQPSDIWALGCTFLVMLTGRSPWDKQLGRREIRKKIASESPVIPEGGISKEAKDFLSKCFVRNPSDRPTAEMLLNHPFVCGTNV